MIKFSKCIAQRVRSSTHSLIKYSIATSKMSNFPIQEYEVGERLDKYIRKFNINWSLGHKHLRKKDIVICKADGTLVYRGDYKLQKGDTLRISKIMLDGYDEQDSEQPENAIQKQRCKQILNTMTLFDNQNITILNKKNGYSVQGGLNCSTNLFSLMCLRYKKQFIHVTHRLDKSTSGLVIFAKNKQTAKLVQIAMEERSQLSKFYIAQTEGETSVTKSAYIRCNIEWSAKNKAKLCNESKQASKDCITFYLPILSQITNQTNEQKEKFRNLLGIKLITGRKHQIRCHLSSYLQQPIVNDAKYRGGGTNQDENQQQIRLHAVGLLIRNREIVDKILAGPSQIVNSALGEMFVNHQQNCVLFTAKLPNVWEYPNKNALSLRNLCMAIEEKEKMSESSKPSRRNMSQIL